MDFIFFSRIALFVHIISLVTAFGSVIVIDIFGLLWIFKRASLSLVVKIANTTQRLIWTGWFGLVLSGSYMLWIKGSIDNLMWVKLFFVVLIGINGVWLHFIKKNFERIREEKMDPGIIFDMSVATSVSQLGWWSAIVIGFLHHEWRGIINWPPNPFAIMILVLTALISSRLIKRFLLKIK